MRNKVYEVSAEITAFIQSKKTTRKGEVIVSAQSAEAITLEVLNEPQNLHRLIPKFLSGKLREGYKCTKILNVKGPLGYGK